MGTLWSSRVALDSEVLKIADGTERADEQSLRAVICIIALDIDTRMRDKAYERHPWR